MAHRKSVQPPIGPTTKTSREVGILAWLSLGASCGPALWAIVLLVVLAIAAYELGGIVATVVFIGLWIAVIFGVYRLMRRR